MKVDMHQRPWPPFESDPLAVFVPASDIMLQPQYALSEGGPCGKEADVRLPQV